MLVAVVDERDEFLTKEAETVAKTLATAYPHLFGPVAAITHAAAHEVALADRRAAAAAAPAAGIASTTSAAATAGASAVTLPVPFSAAQVRWGLQTVAARAYGRRLPHAALVPFADAFNHINVPCKYGLFPVAAAPAAGDDAGASAKAPPPASTDTMPPPPLMPTGLTLVTMPAGDDDEGVDDGAAVAAAAPADSDDASSSDDEDDEEEEEDEDDDDGSGGRSPHPATAPPTGVFRIWPTHTQGYKAGQEVHNSYGRRDNDHLALEYGFLLPDNHWQRVVAR